MSSARVFYPGVLALFLALSEALTSFTASATADFSYQKELSGTPQTLAIEVADLEPRTGTVSLNGGDSRRPATPFTFDWGDGRTTEGFFPQQHTYEKPLRNYLASVTAHYDDGGRSEVRTAVFFIGPPVQPTSCPDALRVSIPDHTLALATRLYAVPSHLTFFTDDTFSIVPRSTVEYVLTLAATLQMDLANQDVLLPDGKFNQVVLRDPEAKGMYSLWYTTPVALAAGDHAFSKAHVEYSSFFHEMAHNVSLNFPAAYSYGGKTDGNANAILSESVAQILQHATAYEIVNHAAPYGLDPALTQSIWSSAAQSMRLLHHAHQNYLDAHMPFCSWNDPATPADETFGTFMTIAYVFCVHAEQAAEGYRAPVKRMMTVLQQSNPDLHRRYDAGHNTPEAAAFRATLMVASLSHAFRQDLRPEFRALNFPLDDAAYADLTARFTGP